MDIRKYIELGIPIPIGVSGENNIESFKFGYGDWASLYGDGVLSINHQRPGDTYPYPCTITTEDYIATWEISATDTQYSGQGRIQVVYMVNGTVKKTMIGNTLIESSLGENVDAVDPISSYIDTMVEIKNDTYQYNIEAKASADTASQKAQDVLGLTADATVNNTVGTPSVDVAVAQDGDHKKMSFSFENLKGDPGEPSIDRYYNSFPKDTATGMVARITDGAEDVPVDDVTVSIKVGQNLNGYGVPWASGFGKNLFNPVDLYHGYYAKADPSSITANEKYRMATIENLPAGTYTFSCDLADCYILRYLSDGTNHEVNSEANSITFTTTTSGLFRIDIRNTSTSTITADVNVQIEKGSVATPWTPYANVCPFTGFAAAEVYRSNRNLLPRNYGDTDSKAGVTRTNANGYFTFNGTPTGDATFNMGHIKLPPGEYILNGCPSGGGSAKYRTRLNIGAYSSSPVIGYDEGNGFRFQLSETTDVYARIIFYTGAGALSNFSYNPMIRVAWDDESGYVPSDVESVTVAFDDVVYGGTLDLINGVLTVDSVVYKASEFASYAKSSNSSFDEFYFRTTGLIVPAVSSSVSSEDIKCSHGRPGDSTTVDYTQTRLFSSQPRIRFPVGTMSSLSAFETWLSAQASNNTPLQFWYRITPQTYQLTAEEIATLKGDNCIWCDIGGVKVTYKADTILKMEKAEEISLVPFTPSPLASYRRLALLDGYRFQAVTYDTKRNRFCEIGGSTATDGTAKLLLTDSLTDMGNATAVIVNTGHSNDITYDPISDRLLVSSGGGTEGEITPNMIFELDPETGEILTSRTLGDWVTSCQYFNGYYWISDAYNLYKYTRNFERVEQMFSQGISIVNELNFPVTDRYRGGGSIDRGIYYRPFSVWNGSYETYMYLCQYELGGSIQNRYLVPLLCGEEIEDIIVVNGIMYLLIDGAWATVYMFNADHHANQNGQKKLITSGMDLDEVCAVGEYLCPTYTEAQDVSHIPSDMPHYGFNFKVEQLVRNVRRQVLICNNGASECYYRTFNTNNEEWNSWYKVAPTIVT